MKLITTRKLHATLLCALSLTLLACGGAAGTPPGASLQCGDGTHEDSGVCAADVRCGEGTHADGGECFADAAPLRCGDGTTEEDGECRAAVVSGLACGSGTEPQAGQCRPVLASICGTDTRISGSSCVSRLACGTGTRRSGEACIATTTSTGATCGAGTVEQSGTCVADGATFCGSGTTWSGTRCVVGGSTPSAVGAFANTSGLKVSYADVVGSYHRQAVIVTDLSQTSANGWTRTRSALLGTGNAVHIAWDSYSALRTGVPVTLAVDASTVSSTSATCASHSISDAPSGMERTQVDYVRWSNGAMTFTQCGAAGTVVVERVSASPVDKVRITFNVQFGDGTLWEEKVFLADYFAQ